MPILERAIGHVRIVEIDQPPANHLDTPTMISLVDLLAGLDADPDCRCIVLSAKGKHFCPGVDFAGAEVGRGTGHAAAEFYNIAAKLFDLGTPLIAALSGATVGGGLGLACAADFRVVDADCRLTANFAALGFHQGFGLSVTLPEIVGRQHAQDLLYTARRIDGIEAFRIGLADRLSAPGGQRELAIEWAHEIAAAAPLAVSSIRQTLRGTLAARVRAALDRELAEQTRLWMTSDAREGIQASLSRRKPTFTGT